MCVHVSEWHIAAVFKSMAIGFVANAGNRLPEHRRVVHYVAQCDTLCSYQLGSIPGTGKALSVVHSFQTTTGPNHTDNSGNCGSSSCDKTFVRDDLRSCSALRVGVLPV